MKFETQYILFTGAGFTANFGGFLADEMWAKIFNHRFVQKEDRVRGLMVSPTLDFDYESIYGEIMESDKYNKAEKNAIMWAVEIAYTSLDRTIKEYKRSIQGGHPSPPEFVDRQFVFGEGDAVRAIEFSWTFSFSPEYFQEFS
jgi:hypothetical protein